MANISHFTQTVNGVSTTYDIHDANAIPRSGGAVITGVELGRVNNTGCLSLWGGTDHSGGAKIDLYGKDRSTYSGCAFIRTIDANNNAYQMSLKPDGTATWGNKNLAMQEDTVPRSGGAVMTGREFYRTINDSFLVLGGGTNWNDGGVVQIFGANADNQGMVRINANNKSMLKQMEMWPNGTWIWNGTACQITSDQRLKQQIAEIDDKLLDAWQDVELCQFKYNDAVDSKGDKARLHTGFVVQQIDQACKSHGVDISSYGLYCHEVYPEETEEIEVEQKDGTKTKERKVIREASEHYSLRYTEALIVECKYLRRCVERLTARIEELEKGNNSK